MKFNYIKKPYQHNTNLEIPKPHKLDPINLNQDDFPRLRQVQLTFLIPRFVHKMIENRRDKKFKKVHVELLNRIEEERKYFDDQIRSNYTQRRNRRYRSR